MRLSAQPEGIAQCIVYELPWRLYPGEAYPTVPGTPVPLLSIRSALPITDGNQPVAGDFIKGRVVVIGGSFWESRDLYLTPLGQMPGFLVLVNAVHSLQQHGEIRPPPLYVKLPITIALILLVSALFAWLRPWWAMLGAGSIILVTLPWFSYAWFKAGVWLDFILPLLAVMGHGLFVRLRERHHARKTAGSH